MRRLLLTLALVASACSGAGGEDLPGTTVAAAISSTTTTTTALPVTPTTKVPGGWHLAWQPTALVDGFAGALADIQGVGTVSMVRVGDTRIVETARADGTIVDQPTDGFVIPAEVHAVDGPVHAGFVPDSVAETLAGLADDEVMLGSTSAVLRDLDAGDTITFSGGYVATVAGVVDDDFVGDAEIVTARSDLQVFGSFLDKYAVFWFDGVRADLEAALESFDGEPVVLRAWGEPLVFRHGDSVRSQVAFKERFGEFTIRPNGGGFEQERAWREENIVTESIPLLGSVTCHRDFIEMLRQAMTELVDAGNGAVINRGSFQGCWNARFIAGREAISHHSFGAAADVNFYEPEDGPFSPTDPDLLVAMYTAGLTSGHVWVNPDPGHFEWFDS
ncbi:MAG: hypothetical protein HKN80_05010 [Acidimicrobiia bacterium]|nr:hypothetical protein [Acidimicrobiia bacterium]